MKVAIRINKAILLSVSSRKIYNDTWAYCMFNCYSYTDNLFRGIRVFDMDNESMLLLALRIPKYKGITAKL